MNPATAARRRDRGSVLMLMPAAVVIMLLLGAVAVDSAVVYLQQRQAYNVAFDAANDAAGAGFDLEEARRSGALVWNPDRIAELAAATVGAAEVDGLELVSAHPAGDVVVVTVAVTVEHLFAPAVGAPRRDELTISARAGAEVRRPGTEP